MEFPDTESQEKALRVVQRLGVPYSVYECKPTKRWSDEDSIESAVDKVLGEPQEDVDPAHTVGPNWKALKPTYKANDGTTYAIYDNGGELVVSKWDPDTDAKESVAEVPYKYQDSASRSRALHQVREYVRGLLVARGGTKSVSRGVEPPPLESLQTEVVHLKTGSGKTLCDTSGDLGRRSPTYLVTSDVNEVTCTKCKAKMKRKGKRGKVKSERCSRCKSTNVEVTPLEDRPEVGVVECKSCGFHQLVDQPTRLGERVEITADHPLGDKLALWLDYKDPFDKDTLLGAGDALGAGRRGSFEITHVDIMEDPIAQFRPQNLYYLRGKVDSTEGIQYFAMMYGTDEGPRWYTFAISPNASDLPSMEDMAAEGGNPPEEPLSGVPPHGVGDAIERAVDKVLAEQGPAIHSKCVYYGSNPQREGWGKCSNPDSGSTDVKGDQPACSKFGPRKEESTRQVREQEGEPTPPKKDEKPTVWVARHKRLAVPEQFDTLVKDHGGKVVVDDVNLNTVAIEFTTQEKAEEFSQMWTNVTGETPNLNFSHQPPEYEPGKEPKSGT
jgi:Zn ribbon nucleic-acid-binding protein